MRCERSEPRRATARAVHPSRAASRPPQDDGQHYVPLVLQRLVGPFNWALAGSRVGAMPETFESALQARVDTMVDACTRCGKCVAACPTTVAAGLTAAERADPVGVIGGVIDILRGNEGTEAARKWASGCIRSGDCIEACDYGVNPRFLLGMARAAMARSTNDAAALRKKGVDGFRHVARDVNAISKIQLDGALLARLGQAAGQGAKQ